MKRTSRLMPAMAGLALAWPVLADPPSHAPPMAGAGNMTLITRVTAATSGRAITG